MQITSANLVYYLLDKNLVSHESIVDGGWMVTEATRRNRNFKVMLRESPGYFIKQAQSWDPLGASSLECEANCYRLASHDAGFTSLAPFLPKYYDFDRGRSILITELLQGAENLSEYHRRLGTFPEQIAAQLGVALATYHRETGRALRRDGPSAQFASKIPWILTVDQLSSGLFSSMSAANSQLVSIVQKYPEFQQSLAKLRSEWQAGSLIHGDIKWDNCIVCAKEGEPPEIKLIDWELADLGDAGWDAGAVFQAYLSFWIFSMPATPETAPAELVERAQYPLEAMQPAIRAFWNAYAAQRELVPEEVAALLRRSVQYGAARMIQTAYEYMYNSPQVTSSVLYLLQVSLNILAKPDEAITHLLDLQAG